MNTSDNSLGTHQSSTHQWPCRSRFYIQYHLFEQLWRANGGAFHAGDAHAALLNFKMFLDTTVGGAVVVAWEELQLCKGSKENAELTEAKRRCLSTLPVRFTLPRSPWLPLTLTNMPKQIPHSGTNTWAEVWEASVLERLRSYWLPSYVTSRQQRVPTARDDYPLVALHSDPCCVALMDERDMGAPLGHYLQRLVGEMMFYAHLPSFLPSPLPSPFSPSLSLLSFPLPSLLPPPFSPSLSLLSFPFPSLLPSPFSPATWLADMGLGKSCLH